MAAPACGKSISTRVAPRPTSTSSAPVTASATCGSTPFSNNARGTPMRAPRTSPVRPRLKSGTGSGALVASAGSRPAMTFSAIAARSAWNPIGRPGVPRRTERRVLGRRAHRELVAVRLADNDGAGRLELLDDRRVVGRHERLEDLRGRGRADAPGADVVFERHRDAGQWTVAPAIAVAIERGGALEGALGDHRVERVQQRIVRGDAGKRGFA